MARVALATPKRNKPVLKTYSRKRKLPLNVSADESFEPGSPTTSTASSSGAGYSLVPPCHPTLVAFRGLLIHRRVLLKAGETEPVGRMDNTGRKQRSFFYK